MLELEFDSSEVAMVRGEIDAINADPEAAWNRWATTPRVDCELPDSVQAVLRGLAATSCMIEPRKRAIELFRTESSGAMSDGDLLAAATGAVVDHTVGVFFLSSIQIPGMDREVAWDMIRQVVLGAYWLGYRLGKQEQEDRDE